MIKQSFWALSVMFTSVLLAVACTRKFDAQPACNFVQNTNLQRVSWNRNLPVKLFVHRSMPLDQYPEMEAQIRLAVDTWNRAAGRELLRLEAFNVGGPDEPARDGYSVIYWMNRWEPNHTDQQARTTIYWSGSQIYEADIRINASNYKYHVASEVTGFARKVDFASLLIHELGHALGLGHNIEKASVMQAKLEEGLDRRALGEPDKSSMACEYM